ncbi:DUF7660 family protein [Luteimonas panaciterrae]|uniref:DUF7660 family protein n=1 Tax=Luteimonas panaciterrae TaxID=363885 RepID=UPI001CFB2211|nr:hypothetical protein [Luteimonas panaciterrae]
MNKVNFEESIKHIESRDDFVGFVRALKNDLLLDPESWENPTLEEFLEALSSWTEDMDGYYKNNNLPMPTDIPWSRFAEILLASKYYE